MIPLSSRAQVDRKRKSPVFFSLLHRVKLSFRRSNQLNFLFLKVKRYATHVLEPVDSIV